MLKNLLPLLLLIVPVPAALRPGNDLFHVNGGKSLLDAHNCYPYDGQYSNRITRALSTGFPVAIEQDIAPFRKAGTGEVIAKVRTARLRMPPNLPCDGISLNASGQSLNKR